MRDFLWFCGFKIFWAVAHPRWKPLIIARRMVHKLKGETQRLPMPAQAPSRTVPKKIWIYWAQGWDEAPRVVLICRASWKVRNPDWEIISLDDRTLPEYVALDPSLEAKHIPRVWYADIARLHLLAKYGGVWADATTLCATPLHEWLPGVMQTGFFAFDKPKTTLVSWFLATEKDNELMQKWAAYADKYWKFTERTKRYWIFFLFEYLLLLHKPARVIWHNTLYMSSAGAYVVQNFLKQGSVSANECARLVTREVSPVHKLDWKMHIPNAVLDKLELQLSKS